MTQSTRLYDLKLFFHAETKQDEGNEGAILVSHDGDKEKAVWLPKSQVEWQKQSPVTVLVTAPEWLVIDKGLDHAVT